ncbi:ribonuclease H-like domain-containing protein [Tanacetum coccineum]
MKVTILFKKEFVDDVKFTYGPKQSKTSESDSKTSDFASCESNFSVETLESVPKPDVNKPKAVSKPNGTGQRGDKTVWKQCAKIESPKQVCSKLCPVTYYKTSRRPVNVARQNLSSQAVATSTARKVNTAIPIDGPQKDLKNKGIIDSGCSRHMTQNKAYLVEYQDYNGGPVAFGGHKGYISDTECLVLSPDFKLPDENQVLLRVPRQNNMYSFNLENIVPTRGLACLIAKATIDESNKWHRRDIIEFCGSKRIKREYSNARTPQQNGVAKRKNKTLIEDARTMLADSFLSNTFLAEAVSTACYVLNRVLVTKPQNKTPYELIIGPKEANHSACTQDNIDAGNSIIEAEPTQEYFVLPLWSSYTSTVKSLEAKNGDEKPNGDTAPKTNEEPKDQEDQAFLEDLERLKR